MASRGNAWGHLGVCGGDVHVLACSGPLHEWLSALLRCVFGFWTPCAGSVPILLVLWGVVARCEVGEELMNMGIQLVPSVCNSLDVG